MSETILEEAERLINGERQQQYGGASESFERIAQLWTGYLGCEPLTGFDVANLMILLKVSRAKGSLDRYEFHRDSYVDIAGYAALAERLKSEIDEAFAEPDEQPVLFDATEPVVEQPKPRVWGDLRTEVPISVDVRDKDGDVWKWTVRHGWQCWLDGKPDPVIQDPENYEPYTEVLDSDEIGSERISSADSVEGV